MPTPKLVAEFERLYAPKIISSKAEYRRADYVFPREQSRAMRQCAWEEHDIETSFAAKVFQFSVGFWLLMGPFLCIATGVWK